MFGIKWKFWQKTQPPVRAPAPTILSPQQPAALAKPRPQWEIDREKWFEAVRNEDLDTIRAIHTKYQDEALDWLTKAPGWQNCTAVSVAYFEDKHLAFELLLDIRPADMEHNITVAEADGTKAKYSLLSYAVKAGKEDFVRILLERGANINGSGEEGKSLKELASKNGHGLIHDMLKRADKIRAEYLAAHPEKAPVAPAVLTDDVTVFSKPAQTCKTPKTQFNL